MCIDASELGTSSTYLFACHSQVVPALWTMYYLSAMSRVAETRNMMPNAAT